jgi:transcriptional regulator of arginine metabolism
MRNSVHWKVQRHKRIINLIRSRKITSQQELEGVLAEDGIPVTQGTLSRDLRELNLVKTPLGYRQATELAIPDRDENRVRDTISQFMIEVSAASNLVVIHTHPGSAHPVALSLDSSGWREIVGTVAGDDTVLVVARSAPTARSLRKRIQSLTTR